MRRRATGRSTKRSLVEQAEASLSTGGRTDRAALRSTMTAGPVPLVRRRNSHCRSVSQEPLRGDFVAWRAGRYFALTTSPKTLGPSAKLLSRLTIVAVSLTASRRRSLRLTGGRPPHTPRRRCDRDLLETGSASAGRESSLAGRLCPGSLRRLLQQDLPERC
jgi:hypothetical protein